MSEQPSGAHKQVLVADDDPAILRLVKIIVEKEGYAVVSARDGKRGLQTTSIGRAVFGGNLRCRDAVYSRHGTRQIYAVGKASDENSRDYDDGGAKSASVFREFCGGRSGFFAQTFYNFATANDASDVCPKQSRQF